MSDVKASAGSAAPASSKADDADKATSSTTSGGDSSAEAKTAAEGKAQAGGILTDGKATGGDGSKDDSSRGGEQGQADGKKADDKVPAGAGEFKVVLPEGAKVDAKSLEAFTAVAKETGLTSEAASKLAAWDLARQADAQKQYDAETARLNDDWGKALAADPDIGGKKFAQSVAAAHQFAVKFGGDELKKGLVEMGLQNWPPLVKAFARAGLAIGEDSAGAPSAKAGGGPRLTEQERLNKRFPSSAPKG